VTSVLASMAPLRHVHYSIAFCLSFFFFFSSRRRHTRWPRDWSSDVCSSDLERARLVHGEVRSLAARPFVEAALALGVPPNRVLRSEERRVGKECRSRGSPDH